MRRRILPAPRRTTKAAQLLDRLRQICTRQGERIVANETPPHLADFIRLQNEMLENPDCLFVFVEQSAVDHDRVLHPLP